MNKLNLILLAGGSPREWYKQYNCCSKACLPIVGRPMISWVIEAFRKSKYIDNIVVVGNRFLNNVHEMKYVKKRVFTGLSLIQNLLHGAIYLKLFIYKMTNRHNGYLISFCDAPLLTTSIVDKTIKSIIDSDADIVMYYVQDETIRQSKLSDNPRSYMTIAGKKYTGSNIYYVRKFSLLWKCLPWISQIRKIRKNPNKILELIDCERQDFPYIEERIGEVLNCKVHITTSNHPEMGIDVDKPEDYTLVNDYISKNTVVEHNPPPETIVTSACEETSLFKSYSGAIKLVAWIAAIALLGYLGQIFEIKELYLQSLNWIKSHSTFAPLLYLGFYLILSGIFLPSLILKISAGFLFGLIEGVILVTIGATVSSIIKFLLARYWCQDLIIKKFKNNKQWLAMDKLIAEKGWQILLLLRNIPVISSLFLNYICGLSSMSLKHFVYASSVGRLPSTILYVYLGCISGNMINAQNQTIEYIIIQWILFAIGMLALIGFTFYCKHILRESNINLQTLSS